MRLSTVFYILKEIRYMKAILKKYNNLLAAGKYKLFDCFRAMSLNEKSTISHAQKYFCRDRTNAKMALLASKLSKVGYFANRNKKSTAEYEAFYTANNHEKIREIKLFSFKREKILTICTSLEETEKQIAHYDLLGKSYNMPLIKKADCVENSLEISMICLKDFPGDNFALSTIINSTVKFNDVIDNLKKSSGRELIAYSYEENINLLLDDLYQRIDSSVLNREFPLCVQHGDLSKDNLMYGENEGKLDFWWIDWEHKKERVFFYDFFFYIMNSAMYYDTKAYDLYMSGVMDKEMEKYFSHFGLTFENDKRKDYLLLYMIIFLKERVCDLGYIEALKEYCDFVKKH